MRRHKAPAERVKAIHRRLCVARQRLEDRWSAWGDVPNTDPAKLARRAEIEPRYRILRGRIEATALIVRGLTMLDPSYPPTALERRRRATAAAQATASLHLATAGS